MAFFAVALAGLVGLAERSGAENFIESMSLETGAAQRIEGKLDWTEQVLVVYGESAAPEGVADPARQRLLGMRGAKVIALRNLAEMVGEVRVDAQTKVGMAMVESDDVYARLSALIRGARVVSGSLTDAEGLYRIAVQIGLRNDFADAVLPLPDPLVVDPLDELLAGLAPDSVEVVAVDSLDASDSPVADTLVVDEPSVSEPPKPYTGLVVDARGLDLRPNMAPRILSPTGYEVYGGNFADRMYATRIGVVGYDKDMDRALVSERLGGEDAHPMVVEARHVSGLYSGDVVVSSEDGVNIRMADREWGFLEECRVVFVLGPKPVVVDTTYYDSLYMDSTRVDTAFFEEDDFDFPGEAEPGDGAE